MIEEVKQLIDKDSRFKHIGRGNNLGLYSTDKNDYIDFNKPIGGKSFGRATIFLFKEDANGLNIKIEVWLPSYCEDYTLFEGWLESPKDFTTIMRLVGI